MLACGLWLAREAGSVVHHRAYACCSSKASQAHNASNIDKFTLPSLAHTAIHNAHSVRSVLACYA